MVGKAGDALVVEEGPGIEKGESRFRLTKRSSASCSGKEKRAKASCHAMLFLESLLSFKFLCVAFPIRERDRGEFHFISS